MTAPTPATARPWAQGDMDTPEEVGHGPIAECWIIKEPDGAAIGFAVEDADAALIVTAVNAHDDLVAAANLALDARDGAAVPWPVDAFAALEPLRALLARLADAGEEGV